MRKTALAGLLVFGLCLITPSPKSSAIALDTLQSESISGSTIELAVLNTVMPAVESEIPKQVETPKVHTVQPGDTLVKIGDQYQTSWERLYFKNTQIKNPNVIEVSEQLTIPEPDEKLPQRPLPDATETPLSNTSVASQSTIQRGSSDGNSYTYGYCTWYAKERRPDLPNNLGNADTWVSRARAQGIATGANPIVGAIGQQGMHVVYVERVHSDGTVTVSEMNREGWAVVSSRRVAADTFYYIY